MPLARVPIRDSVDARCGAAALANDAALDRAATDDGASRAIRPRARCWWPRASSAFRIKLARYPRIAEIPFTSERKRHATVHRDRDDPTTLRVFVKGAPEILLGECRYLLEDGEARTRSTTRAVPSCCGATTNWPRRRCVRSPSPRAWCRRRSWA